MFVIPSTAVPAIFLVPLTMYIAAQGYICTVFTFIFVAVALAAYYYRCKRAENNTQFFYSWALTSFAFLLAVFELEVVPYLEILVLENFALICSVATACSCGYFVRIWANPYLQAMLKSANYTRDELDLPRCNTCSIPQFPRSSHCPICGFCVRKRDHHSFWLDVCVGGQNHRLFILWLFMLLVSTTYGANLTLTTVCHSSLVKGWFMFPDDCSDVYGDIHISLCFVSGVYLAIIAIAAFFSLMQQVYCVCINTTVHEWEKGQAGIYNEGPLHNCFHFWQNS